MACDSSCGFRRGISHFFTVTKIQPRGGRKNKRTIWTWVSSKRKKGKSAWRFCVAFRAFVDYRGRVFRAKLLQKATRNANSSVTVFPHCLLLLTLLPLDCYLTPTGLFCSPLSTALLGFLCQLTSVFLPDLPFLLHVRSRRRSRAQALCLGFAPKQTKRSSARRTHPHSVTLQQKSHQSDK